MAAGISSGTLSKLNIPAGARVCCTTCNGEKIEGEVLAFDIDQKMLVLKLPSSSGVKEVYNISFINTDLLQDFFIIEEPKKSPVPLPAFDMSKIGKRIENNLLVRQKAVERIGVGVSPFAQKLFDFLCRTLEPRWESTKIVVMDVTVSPPYTLDNCIGSQKSIDHVRKLVEKFHAEQNTRLTV